MTPRSQLIIGPNGSTACNIEPRHGPRSPCDLMISKAGCVFAQLCPLSGLHRRGLPLYRSPYVTVRIPCGEWYDKAQKLSRSVFVLLALRRVALRTVRRGAAGRRASCALSSTFGMKNITSGTNGNVGVLFCCPCRLGYQSVGK